MYKKSKSKNNNEISLQQSNLKNLKVQLQLRHNN